jgi:uncharacterized protein (DUF2062 family)
MFQRRIPISRLRRVRDAFWPQMGWRRASQYTLYRIGRLPGSGYAIAGGFAWGAAMSFTPLIGFHILLAIFGAWLTRCSAVAAAIGTAVGNPWTFPFIWIGLYKIGIFMGFSVEGVDPDTMDFTSLFGHVTMAFFDRDWAYLADNAFPVLLPMLAASVPVAIIVWVIFFLLLKPVIERYKFAAHARRTRAKVAMIERLAKEQESTT